MANHLKTFPISMLVRDRVVVMAGGGEEILQKTRLLLKSEADLLVVAEMMCDGLKALVDDGAVRYLARRAYPGDFYGASFAFISTGDAALDRDLADSARASGVPVNVIDTPELCDFYVPAIVERAPVSIAISTEGDAPVLAGVLRGQIEQLLPQQLGPLTRLAGQMRDHVARIVAGGSERRSFWRSFFANRGLEWAVQNGEDHARKEAEAFTQRWADNPDNREGGFVWLVGAGPGAADLLTLRAHRVLANADVVVHDQLVSADVMEFVRRDATRIDVGKRKDAHSTKQADIETLLVDLAKAGKRVVRLKGGDPMVFGRAGEEIDALNAHNIPFEIVPGLTSALVAASEHAVPLTYRGVSNALVFATAQGANGSEPKHWAALARSGASLAIYMGRTVAARVAENLMAEGLAADTPVAAIENISRPERVSFSGVLSELPHLSDQPDLDGPVMILIGEAIARGDWTDAQPLIASALQHRAA